MSERRLQSVSMVIAGAALSAGGVVATATSPFVHDATSVVVVGLSILLPFLVAAQLHVRFPGRALAGLLLAAVGVRIPSARLPRSTVRRPTLPPERSVSSARFCWCG